MHEEVVIIVVFGSINLDLIFSVDVFPEPGRTLLANTFREEPGGKGANQAYAAALAGAQVILHGAISNDDSGSSALSLLKTANIDLSGLRRSPTPTGRAAIWADASGRNMIVVAPGANLDARADDIEDALLARGNTLLVQMENDLGQMSALILRARARGTRIILNLAPAAPLAPEVLRAVDVLIVNSEEARWLGDFIAVPPDAGSLCHSLGVTVIRTQGELGVEVASAQSQNFVLPAHPVRAVDSTAAGDCFVGVFAAELDRGAGLAAAVARANAAGALACTRPGSQRSAPTRIELDAFLAARAVSEQKNHRY